MVPDDDDAPPRSERARSEPAERAERPADRAGDRPADRAPGRDSRPAARDDKRDDKQAREARDRDRDDRYDDGLPDTLRQRLESLVPELVKKTFAAGMGAVFSTEEGIRKLAKESLPEMAGYIASSADGAKDKVFEVIARETREFLSTLNVSEEITKMLTTLSFEIKTEIRFIPNSERFTGAEPDVKASVRLKRADRPERDKPERDKPERDKPERDKPERDKDDLEPRDSRSRLRFWRRDDGTTDDDAGDDK